MTVKLKTKAFEIVGESITQVVEAWFRVKPTFPQYEDVQITSIETMPDEQVTVPEENQRSLLS